MTKPIIGILGGGQLGMMLCDSAKEIDIETHVFCPDDDCPSKGRSTYFSVGEYSDEEKIIKFSNSVDFITYEFENIPIKTIDFIKDQNKISVFHFSFNWGIKIFFRLNFFPLYRLFI